MVDIALLALSCPFYASRQVGASYSSSIHELKVIQYLKVDRSKVLLPLIDMFYYGRRNCASTAERAASCKGLQLIE